MSDLRNDLVVMKAASPSPSFVTVAEGVSVNRVGVGVWTGEVARGARRENSGYGGMGREGSVGSIGILVLVEVVCMGGVVTVIISTFVKSHCNHS